MSDTQLGMWELIVGLPTSFTADGSQSFLSWVRQLTAALRATVGNAADYCGDLAKPMAGDAVRNGWAGWCLRMDNTKLQTSTCGCNVLTKLCLFCIILPPKKVPARGVVFPKVEKRWGWENSHCFFIHQPTDLPYGYLDVVEAQTATGKRNLLVPWKVVPGLSG